VTKTYSLGEVFRQYLDSEAISEKIRTIGELIVSGNLSQESFDALARAMEKAGTRILKETLLDLTLVFARKCVENHELAESEMADLDTLIAIFRIGEGDFYELRRDAVRQVIGAQVMWILRNWHVTVEEEVLQRDLQRLFGLGYDQYVALVRPLAKECIEELESEKLATQDLKELALIDSHIRNLRGVFLVAR